MHIFYFKRFSLLVARNLSYDPMGKLLVHSEVKVTQVYTKIVNQKKNDAVNPVSSVFG